MDPTEVLPLIPDGFYDPSEVVLIGSHMQPSPTLLKTPDGKGLYVAEGDKKELGKAHMEVRSDYAKMLKLEVEPKTDEGAETQAMGASPTLALIYAYGYEGHTYRLSKPRIMIVHGWGKPYEATRDKDPSPNLTGRLYMWKLSKHHQTISIEVESGDLEHLVLDANQPGQRSVNSYAAHMQVSHRGGKIS